MVEAPDRVLPRVLHDVKALLSQVLYGTDLTAQIADDADIIHDLGLDSLQMIRFLLEVEGQLGVTLDFEQLDLAQFGSVRTFAQLLAELQQAKEPRP